MGGLLTIEGPINELNLIDLFQILSFNRKTGILDITSNVNEKAKVYFENGSVVYIKMDGTHISMTLIKAGKIIKEYYEKNIMKKVGTGENEIAHEIVSSGIMSESDFKKFLKTRVEDTVFKIFEWRDGYFKFEEGAFILDDLFKFKIKTESLIMEGSRRIDEWSRLSSKIPSTAIVPCLSDNPNKMDTLDLKPREWEIITMLNGQNSIKDIADKYGDEFEIAKLIYGMITLGIVVTNLTSETIKQEDSLSNAMQFYNDGIYDKAISELKMFIKKHPGNSEAYRIIILVFYATHQFDKINDYVSIAKSNDVNDIFLKKYNAISYFKRGEMEKSTDQLIAIYDEISTPEEQSQIEDLIEHIKESSRIFKEMLGGKSE
ncbi:MAG: hypothetical protein COX48_04900 [bacterium (Candidatus Stahlbacteria) CG23_combo_of_CG06-09_8_20_14_all_34_7]|nr:MAG: hypothetical protein COX48_04900 [bacterium (Candidatus Stahlbacteria) CG23_combo_of_CG06-09_8_20_14_all_34_7]